MDHEIIHKTQTGDMFVLSQSKTKQGVLYFIKYCYSKVRSKYRVVSINLIQTYGTQRVFEFLNKQPMLQVLLNTAGTGCDKLISNLGRLK